LYDRIHVKTKYHHLENKIKEYIFYDEYLNLMSYDVVEPKEKNEENAENKEITNEISKEELSKMPPNK